MTILVRFFYKKFHEKNSHDDMKYRITLNVLLSALENRSSNLTPTVIASRDMAPFTCVRSNLQMS